VNYLAALRRRKWIVLLVIVITTAGAFFFASRQAKEYSASATVLLNPESSLVNNAGKAAAATEQRFDTGQADVAHTTAVAEPAAAAAKVPGVGAKQLLSNSTVTADPNSNILTFSVSARTAGAAAALANQFATAYVNYSKSTQTTAINAAIKGLDSQIAQLQHRIAATLPGSPERNTIYSQLRSAASQRTKDQALLTDSTAGGAASSAQPATSAAQTQPDLPKDLALGLALGVLLGVVLGLLLDVADSRTRTADEVSEALGISLLARIPSPPRKIASKPGLVMLDDPAAVEAEAFRKLRVAFDFANVSLRGRSIMVTSAVGQEGKSTTCANLAVAFALAGRRVALVDLDLRRPMISTYLSIGGQPGVTDVALGHATLDEALVPIRVGDAAPEDRRNPIRNGSAAAAVLHVLPAGVLPPNPVELLESDVLAGVLRDIAASFDVVLIDSAPVLPVADALALANHVDAMIVVARLGVLRRPALRELSRALATSPTRSLGVAVTNAEGDATYRYGYGGGYYRSAPAGGQIEDIAGASRRGVEETVHTAGKG
jgi:Mrp family chromosome partitioning ATPase